MSNSKNSIDPKLIKQLEKQLEYAKEQKFRQDKMRFAFPAAFLVYIGSLFAIIKPISVSETDKIILVEPLNLIVLGLSGLIGIGIFMMTIVEYYHYAKNRDREISIDNFLISTLLNWNIKDNETAEFLIEGGMLDNLDGEKIASRKENKGYKPDLAQPTIIFILFIISLLNGLLFKAGLLIFKSIGNSWQSWVSLSLLISALHMLTYNYWHYFFDLVIKKIQFFFNTTKFRIINQIIWFIIIVFLALWLCCTF